MVDQYINKNFVVIIRRLSNSEPFTYSFRFEGDELTNKNGAVLSKWKNSIISSFFQTDTFIEDSFLHENNIDTFAIRIIIHSAKTSLSDSHIMKMRFRHLHKSSYKKGEKTKMFLLTLLKKKNENQ